MKRVVFMGFHSFSGTNARVAVEPINDLDVLQGEFKIKNIYILPNTLGIRRFRYWNGPNINQIPQYHLRRAFIIFLANFHQLRVV